ncbi:hypothetical protein D3C74_400490 [compost metagenome]
MQEFFPVPLVDNIPAVLIPPGVIKAADFAAQFLLLSGGSGPQDLHGGFFIPEQQRLGIHHILFCTVEGVLIDNKIARVPLGKRRTAAVKVSESLHIKLSVLSSFEI